jgi:Type IV secretion-system coupling protein DNA-binding domain
MIRKWHQTRFGAEWPSEKPVGVIMAFVMAAASTAAILYYQSMRSWPFVERLYLRTYIATGFMRHYMPRTHYAIPVVEGRKHIPEIATDGEIVPVMMSNGEPGIALTEWALKHGIVRVTWEQGMFSNAYLYSVIRHWVFQDQTWWELLRPACLMGFVVLFLGLCVGIPRDRRVKKERWVGRVVRGPLIVTRDQFNRKRQEHGRTEGIGFVTQEPRSLREWLFVRQRYGPMLQIRRVDETRHMLLIGTTSAGKTSAFTQILMQARDRGETAIIYDPEGWFLQRFYTPSRGDLILNPLDQRAPYWSPGEEVQNQAEAMSIAEALFPDRPGDQFFFLDSVRKVFAYIVSLNLSPQDLVRLMCNPRELDALVKGTPYEETLSDVAAGQRKGVLGTLNNMGATFSLLKSEKDAQRHWTAWEWVKRRQGWLFLTSTAATRAALMPLHSLWLDLLTLRLLSQADDPTARRVYMGMDELSTLNRLPQLETALTQNRKANTSILVGLQGQAQIETKYGHIAQTLLAMPWTALFFKTAEPDAAEWVSRYLGEQEIERWRPSQTSGESGAGHGRKSKTDHEERFNRRAVSASEISGLDELRGYLKSGNLIVPFTIKRFELPIVAEKYIERPLPPMFRVKSGPEKKGPDNDPGNEQGQKRETGQGQKFFK